MAFQAFRITTPTDILNLGKSRKGKIAYTVTNMTGRPVTARALLVARDESTADWFSVSGNTERDFPVGGTLQFTIEIAIPVDAKSEEQIGLQLEVVSTELPDEDYASGPPVIIIVPRPEVKKPAKPPMLPSIPSATISKKALVGLGIGTLVIVWLAFAVAMSNKEVANLFLQVSGFLIAAVALFYPVYHVMKERAARKRVGPRHFVAAILLGLLASTGVVGLVTIVTR